MTARTGPVGVGLLGAGAISDQYLATLAQTPDVRVVAIGDLDESRAAAQAARFGVGASGGPRAVLDHADVEIALDLTIPAAHAAVTLDALDAGKHVWSEKPLALTLADADAIIDRADRRGLTVGCAPDTLLAAGAQQTQRLVDDGTIGRPLSAIAIVQNAGPDLWHPNPAFLFAPGAGPVFDLGVYYLQSLVQHLGPVARVTAAAHRAHDRRAVHEGPLAGTAFDVTVATDASALVEFAGGASAVVVASFDAAADRSLLEITGSTGTVEVPQPTEFTGAPVIRRPSAEPETLTAPADPLGRGVGVVDLARALRAGAAPRASADLARHVLEVMLAIETSGATGRPLDIRSTCAPPALLPPGWDARAATL